MGATCGIGLRRIHETPFAVIDFETTGLTPQYDRVIEVAVVRLDPGDQPKLVFDTLINPRRSVAATEIHGITDADVCDAPLFQDIAGDLIEALAGCVVTAYNVYFDIKFLAAELQATNLRHVPPHLCLMYFRPLLGLGCRCRLEEACCEHGIQHEAAHIAAADVQASGKLLALYLEVLRQRNIATFRELADLGSYKFLASLDNDPFAEAGHFRLQRSGQRKSRFLPSEPTIQQTTPTELDSKVGARKYWDALKTAVSDLKIEADEIAEAHRIRRLYQLKNEQIRAMHSRAYASVIAQFVNDQWLDDSESLKLRQFHKCLSDLGWAPGE